MHHRGGAVVTGLWVRFARWALPPVRRVVGAGGRRRAAAAAPAAPAIAADLPREPRPLRFAILGCGTTFPAWQARCVWRLLALGGVEPVLLIVDERPAAPAPPPGAAGRGRREHLLWGLYSLYTRRRARATWPVDLAPALMAAPTLTLRDDGAPLGGEHRDDTPGAGLRDYNLDFILQFTPGPPPEAVLRAPRHGVWSFHFGDRARRGGPPGFWEVYRGDTSADATLQAHSAPGAPGVILSRGHFRTFRYSFVRTHDELLLGVVDWPARICRVLQRGVAPPCSAGVMPPAAFARRPPTNAQVARVLTLSARRAATGVLQTLFQREEWAIGVVDAPIQAFLRPGARPAIRWLPPAPPVRFIADPFALDRGPDTVVLVEVFDYRRNKGHIAALALDDPTAAPRPVIAAPVHMSYPYLIEYDGEIYCIPETREAGEVRLYRAVAFPRHWVHTATLLEGFPAIDATVFQHEGRWWLLCAASEGDHGGRLYAWHAPTLLGPWIPHAANPLKTDVRSSRPAGTPFVHAGQLYRPAQDCSRTYGGAVAINHVRRLTPTEFAETVVTIVRPYADSPYPHGLHTLSAVGERTILDAKRLRWTWPGPRRALWLLGMLLEEVVRHPASKAPANPPAY